MSIGAKPSLVLPTALTLVALAVLIGLGTWQLQRKAWKDALLDRIAARTATAPVPFETVMERVSRGEELEYTRVALGGRWLPGREWHLWAPTPAGPGWHIYAPLKTAAGPIVIVNRGFVPDARRNPAKRPTTEGEVRISGLLRVPEQKGTFTPDNAPERNIWYWRDLAGMANTLPAEIRSGIVPFFLDAEKSGAAASAGAPEAGVTRFDIPNNHLQYALTWYGLAVTLLGVYTAFAIGNLRRRSKAVSAS